MRPVSGDDRSRGFLGHRPNELVIGVHRLTGNRSRKYYTCRYITGESSSLSPAKGASTWREFLWRNRWSELRKSVAREVFDLIIMHANKCTRVHLDKKYVHNRVIMSMSIQSGP